MGPSVTGRVTGTGRSRMGKARALRIGDAARCTSRRLRADPGSPGSYSTASRNLRVSGERVCWKI